MSPALGCLPSPAEHVPITDFQVTLLPCAAEGTETACSQDSCGTPGLGNCQPFAGNLATPQQASCWSFPEVCVALEFAPLDGPGGPSN